MQLQVTGERPVDDINVTGGQQPTLIDITAGTVTSVNGKTGAVTIDASDVGALDWINVAAAPYRAHGDGIHDDTTALQAAIDACPRGGIVYLPRGVYKTTATLDLKNGVTLLGSHANLMVGPGMGNADYPCYIQPQGPFTGTSVLQIIGDDDGIHPAISGEQRLVNLMIDGSQLSGTAVDGIFAKGNVQNVVMENVTVRQMPNNGIVTAAGTTGQYPFSWRMRHVMVDSCHAHGYLFTLMTDLTADDCQAIGCWSNGWVLTNLPNSQLANCRAEWNGNYGYLITGNWGNGAGSGGAALTGCATDRNGWDGIRVDATGTGPIQLSGLRLRRDGRNGGAGGGGYAGLRVAAAGMPVIASNVTCFPGVDDDGTHTNSPQYGVSVTGASTLVQLDDAILHAATAGLNDDGTSIVVLDSNITYATGTTDAPVRTPQPGGANWYSVKRFGARGDGTTDDTVAVQAAINAGGVTYFPPGTYLVTTLEAKLGMVLAGLTRSAYAYPVPAAQSSTLKLKSGTNGHLLHGADGINNVQIHDLALNGNKAGNTSGDIIHLDDATAQDTSWHLTDCYLDNAPHDGIYIGTGRQAVKANRVWVMRSANNGVTANGSDAGLDTALIGLSGASGVTVGSGAWVVHLTDCDIWSSTLYGVDASAGPFSLTLKGCGIDRHQRGGLVVGGGTVSVVASSFHSNSQAGDGSYPHISVTAGALTLAGVLFGTSSPTSLPSYCVAITGGALYETANYLYPGSTVSGYVSDPTKVVNSFTGSVSLAAAYQFNVGASGSAASFAALRASSSDQILSGRVTGNTVSRFAMQADGLHQWSNGSISADVGLNRTGANLLGLTTADFAIATAGRGLRVAEGTNAKMGTATLNGTTAVTVSTTAVTATSRIYLTINTPGGTPASPYVFTRTAGTSFQIKSTGASDTSTVAWMIVEPA